MALIMSIFQLSSSPLITSVLTTFKLTDQIKKDIKKMQNSKVVGIGFGIFLAYVVFFLPIMTLEIVHFFPILFEYYMYKGITFDDLIIYMLCFNIPKLLFIGIKWGDYVQSTTAAHFFAEMITDVKKEDEVEMKLRLSLSVVVAIIVYGLVFLVLPLIPVAIWFLLSTYILKNDVLDIIQKSEKEEIDDQRRVVKFAAAVVRRNVVILFLYLAIAYGGMGRMLFNNSGIGEISFWMLITTWILSGWILFFPLTASIGWFIFLLVTKCTDNDDDIKKKAKEDKAAFLRVVGNAFTVVFCPCLWRE